MLPDFIDVSSTKYEYELLLVTARHEQPFPRMQLTMAVLCRAVPCCTVLHCASVGCSQSKDTVTLAVHKGRIPCSLRVSLITPSSSGSFVKSAHTH